MRTVQCLAMLARLALLVMSSVVVSCAVAPADPPAQEAEPVLPAAAAIPLPDLSTVTSADVRYVVTAARKVVEQTPDSARAWSELGNIYQMHEWHRAALLCYDQAAQLRPIDYRWNYYRGRIYEQIDPVAALGAYAAAVELEDGDPSLHVAYARALRRLGRDGLARYHLKQAAVLVPNNPYTDLGLGQLDLQAGSLESARTHLLRAVELNPGQSEAHQSLAQVYLALGDRKAAEPHVDAARRKTAFQQMADPLRVEVTEVLNRYYALARANRASTSSTAPTSNATPSSQSSP